MCAATTNCHFNFQQQDTKRSSSLAWANLSFLRLKENWIKSHYGLVQQAGTTFMAWNTVLIE